MKILNLPNIITISRAFFIPIMIIGAYSNKTSLLLLTIFLLILAWVSDYFDGTIARKYNLITNFGTFFDPIVDKILMLSLFFTFADLKLIPMWIVLLLLFREFFATGIRGFASLKGKVVGSNWMGKTKWNGQMIIVAYTLIFLWARSLNYTLTYGREIIYFGTLIIVLFSLYFAFMFFWWNKKLFLE